MIKRDVYFREICLETEGFEEFKIKLGDALQILYPHTSSISYNNMNIDAFLDWVCDLWWIKEKNIIIKVTGTVSKEIENIMDEIIKFWSSDAEMTIKNGKNKDFEFILLEC